MTDISEQLRDCVDRDDLPDWKQVLAAASRIEKLEAALREIKTLFANEDAWSVPHSIARKALEGKDE
ncbi:hypothetical protein UFOVP908_60 [uncultured Caudovirales phage]|uniref:Uncharacterized protein n=1 Tax=uncultured Caudovirales phage TaxID=2100421 RepID=A0A6J5PY88_9CAUD|nr:hypothetical protein UFOVP908_60 [uncultured Caudovirales phage]CAB4176869.1 hypothetical protein UFOVP990_76 [uncultured Caudovirales phage]CAB4182009.1 hypothetical protein UFOVP1065_107 [uncultured Caudovirales phage]CAB4190610.1 hypothetical protein UFOVP1198_76 [uncultured Caudovirales phage]CAB4211040.1 hypothetical protein UFOVP1418_68 [uncultured Caudovirales phage]